MKAKDPGPDIRRGPWVLFRPHRDQHRALYVRRGGPVYGCAPTPCGFGTDASIGFSELNGSTAALNALSDQLRAERAERQDQHAVIASIGVLAGRGDDGLERGARGAIWVDGVHCCQQ